MLDIGRASINKLTFDADLRELLLQFRPEADPNPHATHASPSTSPASNTSLLSTPDEHHGEVRLNQPAHVVHV